MVARSRIRELRARLLQQGDAKRAAVCTIVLEGHQDVPWSTIPEAARPELAALDYNGAYLLVEQWVCEPPAAPPPSPPAVAPPVRRAPAPAPVSPTPSPPPEAPVSRKSVPLADPPPSSSPAPEPLVDDATAIVLVSVMATARAAKPVQWFKLGLCTLVVEGREAALALKGLPVKVATQLRATSDEEARAQALKWAAEAAR